MTQQNDKTPLEDRNFVDDMILRRVIHGASVDYTNIVKYTERLDQDEPLMMDMVDKFNNNLYGTITDINDVFSGEADDANTFKNTMKMMFALGFRTGEENMRKFYGEALGGLIEPPHDYTDGDFT